VTAYHRTQQVIDLTSDDSLADLDLDLTEIYCDIEINDLRQAQRASLDTFRAERRRHRAPIRKPKPTPRRRRPAAGATVPMTICPICREEMDQLHVVCQGAGGTGHFVCGDCLPKLSNIAGCPLCRGPLLVHSIAINL